MKKKLVLRALLGFPLGISIGFIISILISLIFGNGSYIPCVPELVEKTGSEINAVILQTVLSGLLGAVFAASSVIWEMENWSIAKQTGIYFAITAVTMMPIAYYANWMEHSVFGFLGYFGIFVLIFAFVWIAQYLIWKNKIEKVNRSIKEIGENH
jgi:hypothetical protein